MTPVPTTVPYHYVDTQPALDALVKEINQAPLVAVDTEADSLHHYYEKVCLIQLSLGVETYIVDPLASLEFDQFMKALSDTQLIFHGAEYDMRMLWAAYKFRPNKELFDTMLAAQLVEGEARSLAKLVERYADVVLSKQGRKSDWSRRPLTEKQLTYAGDDTRYLEHIADELRSELERLGRLDWHREACRKMIKVTGLDKPEPDPERVWRIKGLSEFDRRQLAFVREIWWWREREAQKTDKPPFKVVGNSLIIELALWAAGRKRHPLREGPRLPRNCVRGRLELLEKAIETARNMPESDWPNFLRGGGTGPVEYGSELDQLKSACAKVAEKLGLEPSLVASRRQLEAISLARPKTNEELQLVGKLMDWQVDLLLPLVKEIL